MHFLLCGIYDIVDINDVVEMQKLCKHNYRTFMEAPEV